MRHQKEAMSDVQKEFRFMLFLMEQAHLRLKRRGWPIPVELSEAMVLARRIRAMLDTKRTSEGRLVPEWLAWIVKLMKEIHDLLHCFFTRLVCT